MAGQSMDKNDRSLIQGGEDHNARELAVTAGISFDEAQELVQQHGDDMNGLADGVAAKQAARRELKS